LGVKFLGRLTACAISLDRHFVEVSPEMGGKLVEIQGLEGGPGDIVDGSATATAEVVVGIDIGIVAGDPFFQ